MIKGVLLDLSGTIYVGDDLLPGALEAVQRLHETNIPVRYITNTSRSPRNKIVRKLGGMGFKIPEQEIFTAPSAMQNYLREHHLSPFLIVHPDVEEEFGGFDSEHPNVVVLCDAAESFTYDRLNQAFRLLLEGACLLAVGDNRYFKEDEGMSLDAGPFVRALEYASGKEAVIVGKPSPVFFHAAAAQLNCELGQVLMVGDDVYSDINGALRAGMKAALVQTGKYRPGDEQKIAAPGACVCKNVYEAIEGALG